jgi:hypothetical protein
MHAMGSAVTLARGDAAEQSSEVDPGAGTSARVA